MSEWIFPAASDATVSSSIVQAFTSSAPTVKNEIISNNLYDEFIGYGPGFMEEYNVTVIKDHHFYEGIRKYNMFFAG